MRFISLVILLCLSCCNPISLVNPWDRVRPLRLGVSVSCKDVNSPGGVLGYTFDNIAVIPAHLCDYRDSVEVIQPGVRFGGGEIVGKIHKVVIEMDLAFFEADILMRTCDANKVKSTRNSKQGEWATIYTANGIKPGEIYGDIWVNIGKNEVYAVLVRGDIDNGDSGSPVVGEDRSLLGMIIGETGIYGVMIPGKSIEATYGGQSEGLWR